MVDVHQESGGACCGGADAVWRDAHGHTLRDSPGRRDPAQKTTSFERYRRSVQDVGVITFDELCRRACSIVEDGMEAGSAVTVQLGADADRSRRRERAVIREFQDLRRVARPGRRPEAEARAYAYSPRAAMRGPWPSDGARWEASTRMSASSTGSVSPAAGSGPSRTAIADVGLDSVLRRGRAEPVIAGRHRSCPGTDSADDRARRSCPGRRPDPALRRLPCLPGVLVPGEVCARADHSRAARSVRSTPRRCTACRAGLAYRWRSDQALLHSGRTGFTTPGTPENALQPR